MPNEYTRLYLASSSDTQRALERGIAIAKQMKPRTVVVAPSHFLLGILEMPGESWISRTLRNNGYHFPLLHETVQRHLFVPAKRIASTHCTIESVRVFVNARSRAEQRRTISLISVEEWGGLLLKSGCPALRTYKNSLSGTATRR